MKAARALQALGLVAALSALTAGIVLALSGRPTDAPVVAVSGERVSEPLLADVTRRGRIVLRDRLPRPHYEPGAWMVRRTQPVTPEVLDAIQVRLPPDRDVIDVFVYEPRRPWVSRPWLVEQYRFTRETGWVEVIDE